MIYAIIVQNKEKYHHTRVDSNYSNSGRLKYVILRYILLVAVDRERDAWGNKNMCPNTENPFPFLLKTQNPLTHPDRWFARWLGRGGTRFRQCALSQQKNESKQGSHWIASSAVNNINFHYPESTGHTLVTQNCGYE